MMAWLTRSRLIAFVLGVVGFLVSQRYLRYESYYLYVLIASLVLCSAGVSISKWNWWFSRSSSDKEASRAWFYVVLWQGMFFLGLLTYLLYQHLLGSASVPESFSQKIILGLSLLLIVISFFAGIGIEVSMSGVRRGDFVESKRIAKAGLSWAMVGMVLASLVCFNYAGSKRDKVYDWSYLKTTTPSEVSIRMFASLENPMEVYVFYPMDNEVRPFVADYFDYLADKNSNLKLAYADRDIEPAKAEELKVSKNGQIVFRYGEKRERIDVGTELSSARQVLKKLDAEVQKMVLRLSADKKKLYFTKGHGEFSWSGSKKDPFRSLDLFDSLLRSQNYSVQTIGMNDGLGSKIPEDAAAVVIVGPDTPFLQQEVDTIWTYLESGGRLAVFLDAMPSIKDTPSIVTDQSDPLIEMLKKAGIVYTAKVVANEKNYVSATRSPADHWFIFSNSFSSHESVTTLSRSEEKSALLMFRAGYFDVEAKKDDWRPTTTVRSVSESFVDENKNFRFDKASEKKKTLALGVASSRPVNAADKDGKPVETDARIVAFADANMLSDVLIRTRANALLALDSLKWLTGQTDFSGEISSEEDIKIQHTNKEDVLWFNATVVLVPGLVLLAGFFATRKRRRK